MATTRCAACGTPEDFDNMVRNNPTVCRTCDREIAQEGRVAAAEILDGLREFEDRYGVIR